VVDIPNAWTCRDYQAPLWRYLDGGGKRAVAVWHRRAGKDSLSLHYTTYAALTKRVGVYWHILPTQIQGRRVIWENVDSHGNRMMDAWPGWRTPGREDGVVAAIRHDQMKVELHNGSIWYVVGSDNYDSVMGTNPVGIVFSEWSLSNPRAWDYVRPILTENGGWAIFIYTPRGRGHGATMHDMAQDNPDWFCQKLTVADTHSISMEAIDAERREGVAEEHIQQEYYCSFDAPLVGSFWGKELMECERDGRITSLPHDEALLVDTWWDLGLSDATAVWYTQRAGNEIHIINYEEASERTPAQDVQMLNRMRDEHGYNYGRHIWPHDGGHKTKASKGRPLSALYGDLNIYPEVQPRHDVEVAVQRVRQILPRCWFDKHNCADGLDALRAFKKAKDEDKSTDTRPYYRPGYIHDWSSHGASAFYTGAMVGQDAGQGRPKRNRYSVDEEAVGSAWSA
jgi:phage terminase large subunit